MISNIFFLRYFDKKWKKSKFLKIAFYKLIIYDILKSEK